jgi:hypothetical protein
MSITTTLQLMHYWKIVLQLMNFVNSIMLQLEFNRRNSKLQLINLLMNFFLQLMSIYDATKFCAYYNLQW